MIDYRDPDLEWLDHVRPVGLVVAPRLIKELGLTPLLQTASDSAVVADLIHDDPTTPSLTDPWAFMQAVLGWEARHVAGAPGGPALDPALDLRLPEHDTTLRPDWAVAELGADRPQLLVRIEAAGVDPDGRGALDGWEATPHQRFERLLRESGVFAGVLISERSDARGGETIYHPELRLIYAPRGETSGYVVFPLRPLRDVAGRPMLAGLKLLLGAYRLFSDAPDRRLPALLKRSRDAQAAVSGELAAQVLGTLHELLRGLDAVEPDMIRALAAHQPMALYDGLLAVLMRLVFVLYAEDRDLLPSRPDAKHIYETSYSLRGLYARLLEDAAANPDTMDERVGGWGRLIALFRLIHGGHASGFILARRGKLFDPDEHLFLEGRAQVADPGRILKVSDGCLLRVLEGLMTLKSKGGGRERLSYRTLDVEQIGSVYETVMGFAAQPACGASLAIKAGKNNKTPVYLNLDALAAQTGVARIKHIAETAGRTLTAAQAKPVQAAQTVEDLAAALASVVDERGSPKQRITPAETPILQPTDERRRTGSHYTPRSLTAPIVRHALEPAFARLGPQVTADEVLDLKVCDPAMGSGAFLVEACRVLGERLAAAWAAHPDSRPAIPDGEDEELLAKRLVAQRCLYGVDRNPRAVDLAKLSLWLATLAGGHEFTFLDHALKCGDSLVGLTRDQIAAMDWDLAKPPTLVGALVQKHLEEAQIGRAKIRATAEFATEAELRPQMRGVDAKLAVARLIGDGVIGAWFHALKTKPRLERLYDFQNAVQSHLGEIGWMDAAAPFVAELARGEHAVAPFHWPIEFPEVFSQDNPGFDAIVGNPPFAGKNTLIDANRAGYLPWLQTLHLGAHGNADLVAHFFRRAYGLLRGGGVFGLIATNTIGQGDTRATGLTDILQHGGVITRAVRRHKWLGEAAVVVSIIHVARGDSASAARPLRHGARKSAAPPPPRRGAGEESTFDVAFSSHVPQRTGEVDRALLRETEGASLLTDYADEFATPILDGVPVRRISAYLVEGDLDTSPAPLAANAGKAFVGSYVLGMGFTFDDTAAAKGVASSLADMRALIAKDPRNAQRIFPYIGGEEVNTDPRHAHHRYVIDFADFPLDRREGMTAWAAMTEKDRSACLTRGLVPGDYLDPVAEDWPDLIGIVERLVKPERDPQTRQALKERWWQYAEKRPGLYDAVKSLTGILATSRVSPYLVFSTLTAGQVYTEQLIVFSLSNLAPFAALQSRTHELWARFFSSTLEERLRYAPSDCFRTFPFPAAFETDPALEAAGAAYHAHRAALMIARNEGLTKTYNRFHARAETAPDIETLRALHADMDRAVLAAYGWHDLAAAAAPQFIEQDADDGKTPKTRLDWPSEFKDAVLARLLALNAARAAEERAAGVVADIDDEPDDEA